MLANIYLRDFAIIEELSLDLSPGMTALTGETGAGKSILLDAIGLVLGDRADSGFVRHGCEKTEITLSVDIEQSPSAKQWLDEQALGTEENCIIRRVITQQGKSRAWINGVPVNLSSLKQLGENIIDIHGQHEHQSLMKREQQRRLLDEYAGATPLLKNVEQAYQHYKVLRDKRDQLLHSSQDVQAKIDLLTFQTQELDELALQADEYQQLNEEHARLANMEQLKQVSSKVYHQLYDDDQSIYSIASALDTELAQLSLLDEQITPIKDILENSLILLQEASNELRYYQDKLDQDPERLSDIEQRLDNIQTLARKHRIKPDELVEKTQNLNQQLAELSGDNYNLDVLEAQLLEAEQHYYVQAEKLSQKRHKSSNTLSKKIAKAMQTLGMGGGVFSVAIKTNPQELSAHGIDTIDFMVSANPGQPIKPLNKVASGGELSRISLAIQMITAQKLTLPALIFDEVDSGIGGGTAEIVGKQLRTLGTNRQVLCVTHLAQVAAQAHQHYQVTKIKSKDKTTTGIIQLDKQQRISEIARMMGGTEITASTLALAEEMLEHCPL